MHFNPNLFAFYSVALGIWLLLLAYRVFPRKPRDPERMELWHRKFDKGAKIISPFLIGGGLLKLFGIF
jgi:hypothetical protein